MYKLLFPEKILIEGDESLEIISVFQQEEKWNEEQCL